MKPKKEMFFGFEQRLLLDHPSPLKGLDINIYTCIVSS
jgi:hypothetical protein